MKTGSRSFSRTVIACAVASLVTGCTIAGPGAIRSGRMAYNEAISETNNQQMLMVPVHNRYEESNQLLAVASVTANVRVSSKASIQAGFGNSDTYDGNLVPFSGGFIYEENPTISYKPVTGEAYLQQLTSPLPLSLFSQITRTLPDPSFAYDMLLTSINGIHNPAFLYGDQQDDPRFDQLVEIMMALTRDNRLYWVSAGEDDEDLSLFIRNQDGDARVAELLSLLGIAEHTIQSERIVLPVSVALQSADDSGVAITTHSLWELVEILTAAVQVPPAAESSGVAAVYPRPGRAGRELTVHYSEKRPQNAYVAVEYRDSWYAIDRTDQATKRYFKMLGNLWSAAISQSLDDGSASPVLTVPVSR